MIMQNRKGIKRKLSMQDNDDFVTIWKTHIVQTKNIINQRQLIHKELQKNMQAIINQYNIIQNLLDMSADLEVENILNRLNQTDRKDCTNRTNHIEMKLTDADNVYKNLNNIRTNFKSMLDICNTVLTGLLNSAQDLKQLKTRRTPAQIIKRLVDLENEFESLIL